MIATPAESAVGARLLKDLRAEVARADSKASLLLGAQSMTVGLIGGLVTAQGWNHDRHSAAATALWTLSLAALAVSLLLLLFAVLPRHSRSPWAPGRSLTYFDDIRLAARQGLLPEALAATEADPRTCLLDSLAENSRIVSCKHRCIRAGLAAYCVGVLLLLVALLLR